MAGETELWQFIAERIRRGSTVVLLTVAESSGSSPGRAGYKMAVCGDGQLIGSIGGGVMEIKLVEMAKRALIVGEQTSISIEQVHRRGSSSASGMICSGSQTVVLKQLGTDDLAAVDGLVSALYSSLPAIVEISSAGFAVSRLQTLHPDGHETISFERAGETDFVYRETLGSRPRLYIVGGGHCSLALCEVMARLGFEITVFDDRPELNTLDKNQFASRIEVIADYAEIGSVIPEGDDVYVVVMTLGFASDAVVIRELIGHRLKYFGVLGSKAKMTTLIRELIAEGVDGGRLSAIKTPIGLPINSHTPEEIAISIAAEIISVRNT